MDIIDYYGLQIIHNKQKSGLNFIARIINLDVDECWEIPFHFKQLKLKRKIFLQQWKGPQNLPEFPKLKLISMNVDFEKIRKSIQSFLTDERIFLSKIFIDFFLINEHDSCREVYHQYRQYDIQSIIKLIMKEEYEISKSYEAPQRKCNEIIQHQDIFVKFHDQIEQNICLNCFRNVSQENYEFNFLINTSEGLQICECQGMRCIRHREKNINFKQQNFRFYSHQLVEQKLINRIRILIQNLLRQYFYQYDINMVLEADQYGYKLIQILDSLLENYPFGNYLLNEILSQKFVIFKNTLYHKCLITGVESFGKPVLINCRCTIIENIFRYSYKVHDDNLAEKIIHLLSKVMIKFSKFDNNLIKCYGDFLGNFFKIYAFQSEIKVSVFYKLYNILGAQSINILILESDFLNQIYLIIEKIIRAIDKQNESAFQALDCVHTIVIYFFKESKNLDQTKLNQFLIGFTQKLVKQGVSYDKNKIKGKYLLIMEQILLKIYKLIVNNLENPDQLINDLMNSNFKNTMTHRMLILIPKFNSEHLRLIPMSSRKNFIKTCYKILTFLQNVQHPIIIQNMFDNDDSLFDLNFNETIQLYSQPQSLLFDLDINFLQIAFQVSDKNQFWQTLLEELNIQDENLLHHFQHNMTKQKILWFFQSVCMIQIDFSSSINLKKAPNLQYLKLILETTKTMKPYCNLQQIKANLNQILNIDKQLNTRINEIYYNVEKIKILNPVIYFRNQEMMNMFLDFIEFSQSKYQLQQNQIALEENELLSLFCYKIYQFIENLEKKNNIDNQLLTLLQQFINEKRDELTQNDTQLAHKQNKMAHKNKILEKFKQKQQAFTKHLHIDFQQIEDEISCLFCSRAKDLLHSLLHEPAFISYQNNHIYANCKFEQLENQTLYLECCSHPFHKICFDESYNSIYGLCQQFARYSKLDYQCTYCKSYCNIAVPLLSNELDEQFFNSEQIQTLQNDTEKIVQDNKDKYSHQYKPIQLKEIDVFFDDVKSILEQIYKQQTTHKLKYNAMTVIKEIIKMINFYFLSEAKLTDFYKNLIKLLHLYFTLFVQEDEQKLYIQKYKKDILQLKRSELITNIHYYILMGQIPKYELDQIKIPKQELKLGIIDMPLTFHDLQIQFVSQRCHICNSFPYSIDNQSLYLCLICGYVCCNLQCALIQKSGNLNHHAFKEHSYQCIFMNLFTCEIFLYNHTAFLSFGKLYDDFNDEVIFPLDENCETDPKNILLNQKQVQKLTKILQEVSIVKNISQRINSYEIFFNSSW